MSEIYVLVFANGSMEYFCKNFQVVPQVPVLLTDSEETAGKYQQLPQHQESR